MKKFKLKNDTVTYEFGLGGEVYDGENKIGNWTTNQANEILVTLDTGEKETFKVKWWFNTKHQLCIKDDEEIIFNFNTISDNHPRYSTKDSVLIVRPRHNYAFEFGLRGEWDLSQNHLLQLTINGVVSTFDGYLSDRRSRFIYHFRDKDREYITSMLGFVGTWEEFTEKGIPKLKFSYNRENGTKDTFELPASIKINRSINQFVYEYDKDGRSHRITLLGYMEINEKFDITYTIDHQTSGKGEEMVAKTTFALKTKFTGKRLDGDLEFLLVKEDGSIGDYKLGISGQFTGVLGATSVQVGFQFVQIRRDGNIETIFGFGGNIEWKEDSSASWKFSGNSTTNEIKLELGTEIAIGEGAGLISGTDIIGKNGKIGHVRLLLGVRF
jgi:hypothetical protein